MPDFQKVTEQEVKIESEQTTNKKPLKPTETKSFISSTDAADIVKTVCESITNKNYESVKDKFTDDGYEMFINLAKYGSAKVLNFNQEFDYVEMQNFATFRSVSMQFTFGKEIMIEDVNFSFNKDGKISSLAFAMSDKAEEDIMNTEWSLYSKYQILEFMENYQTAFNLKRLDYINSIFSENALIIVGHMLKTAEVKDNNQVSMKNNIQYNKLTKTEYLNRLDRSFSNNQYINVTFENTNVKQGKLENVYGIQLSQNYTSTNYSDKGYLFLLIDLRDAEKPLIHVRTWQPDKNLDGSIYGVDDFYFD